MPLTLNNNLKSLKIGDYFYCKYTATTSGQVGTFSDLAIKSDADVSASLIPIASSATPNGYFKFIVTDFDHLGRAMCVADRNIQHSNSWDTINTKGIASGSGLPTIIDANDPTAIAYTIRLLTGGISSSDTDNEWNKYIVSSTLNGAITAGDNAVWNWSGIASWTSSVGASSNRIVRGNTTVGAWAEATSSSNSVSRAFRPVLLIESLTVNKILISLNGEYKKWSLGTPTVVSNSTAIPIMTSNISPSGVASASSFTGSFDAWMAFDGVVNLQGWTTNVSQTGWLQYTFENDKIISKYSIITRSNTSELLRMPKNWTFEGSNDGASWDILDNQTNVTTWNISDEKFFSFVNTKYYKHYRINISQNNGDNYLSICELKMFESTPATPPSWVTVSPTLPTEAQFQSDGIDDLSTFDRQSTTINQPMATPTTLGSGKQFSTTVDLTKYFELESLTLK